VYCSPRSIPLRLEGGARQLLVEHDRDTGGHREHQQQCESALL
jgi:hypothetical protein